MAIARVRRADGVALSYDYLPGSAPVVVFFPGFASDMGGGKAMALRAVCAEAGQAMLRLDYSGHGASEGSIESGCIGDWTADAALVIETAAAGQNLLLVGSSMGGWIALLLARRLQARVAALLLIAPAPDFTERLIRPALTPVEERELARSGVFHQPGDYGVALPITRKLLEDGGAHLLLGGRIAIACPVAILHGMRDADVPWRQSLELAEALASDAVELIFVKDGDHRLSRPGDLSLLGGALRRLLGEDGGQTLAIAGIFPGDAEG